MIKARYIGVECELQSGKVYPIKTRCTGNKLVVSVRAYKFEYNSLEEFLKRWKVEAVYHGCRLMILLKEAWSRVRDEGVGVMGDFIGKPFTATTMSELNYLVNAPLESINRELREELGIELYVNTLPQIEDNSVSGFLMVKRVGEPVRFI